MRTTAWSETARAITSAPPRMAVTATRARFTNSSPSVSGARAAPECLGPLRGTERSRVHSGYYPFRDDRMSAFALYVIGFIVLLGGLIYAAWLVHIPQTWI